MHNLCVISLVVLTFILDIALVGFLEISYHIPSMTCKVIDAYKGEHLSNIIVYKFEHIMKKGGMCVIKASFSQCPGWFHGSKVQWNPTDRDNRMGYMKPFIPPKVTAPCNILKHTLIDSISHLPSIVVYHNLCLTEHVDERISTEDSEYGSTWWPFGLATMGWR